ncbi:MAG: magnesium chelatase family protein, partial [Arenicella sp.]
MSTKATGFEKPDTIKSLAMIRTRTVVGISAVPVMVEVHLANGLPSFSTVGLPETAVKESKDRVRGAIINSGFDFPAKRITVNLAPADLPKTGGRFDLPIAIGILIASGQLPRVKVDDFEMVGEVALDGHLRKVSGILPTALSCGVAGRQLVV